MSQNVNLAKIAENSSIPGAAAVVNIAPKHVDKLPTENESNHHNGRYGDMVTQHTYNKAGFTRNCDHCGREYIAKRDTSKYCSQRCRVAAFRARGQA